jgi:hypothetical protein
LGLYGVWRNIVSTIMASADLRRLEGPCVRHDTLKRELRAFWRSLMKHRAMALGLMLAVDGAGAARVADTLGRIIVRDFLTQFMRSLADVKREKVEYVLISK